jgi:hypothetical protein
VFRKSTIFILFVLNLIPHSRYWTVSQHYAISYLPYVPTFMAFALYVAVFMVVLEKKINIEILRMALVGNLYCGLLLHDSLEKLSCNR